MLDDFGIGYSSLSYINRYSIDTIKIDKSFIDGVCTDTRTRAIIDCRAVQGFHFARPLSDEDATAPVEAACTSRYLHPSIDCRVR